MNEIVESMSLYKALEAKFNAHVVNGPSFLIYGNGKENRQIQLCCVDGKQIANIDHLDRRIKAPILLESQYSHIIRLRK